MKLLHAETRDTPAEYEAEREDIIPTFDEAWPHIQNSGDYDELDEVYAEAISAYRELVELNYGLGDDSRIEKVETAEQGLTEALAWFIDISFGSEKSRANRYIKDLVRVMWGIDNNKFDKEIELAIDEALRNQ